MTTGAVSGGPAEFGRVPRRPRPTSRRARAATRRRAAGALPAATAGTTGNGADPRDPEHPPLHHAPAGAQLRRRRTMLLAGMGALTIAGVALAVGGLTAVRNSTVGRYQQALGPSEAGYQASVVPTPTMGLLLRSDDGRLAGAAVLALEPGDSGGSVALVPAAVLVTDATGAEHTLDTVYADQGADAAARALGNAVTVAVNESVEIDEAAWTRFVEPAGPVTVRIDEAVGEWPAGDVELQPEDVGRFLAARTAGEPDLARIERQQAFWTAWLPLVRDAGEGGLPGEVDTGIGRFLRVIAAGDGGAELVPVATEDAGDDVRYRVDAGRVGRFVSLTIPYPTSPAPGVRIRTRLLNGTDDADLTERAARVLVASGAEIAIVGNAGTLSEPETRLVHARGPQAALALWLQQSLQVGRLEPIGSGQPGAAGDDIDDDIDVTVILGQDARDTLEREQTSD